MTRIVKSTARKVIKDTKAKKTITEETEKISEWRKPSPIKESSKKASGRKTGRRKRKVVDK